MYVDLYSALDDKHLVLEALRQTWITQFNLHTPCLPLVFVRVHQMAPPRTVVTTSSCSLLLIYRPRKDERLSWPSWLTPALPSFPHSPSSLPRREVAP